MYFGRCADAIYHFQQLGYECPRDQNPPDFFLDVMKVQRKRQTQRQRNEERRERDRERKRDREAEPERQRDTETQKHRQTEREKETKREKQRKRRRKSSRLTVLSLFPRKTNRLWFLCP